MPKRKISPAILKRAKKVKLLLMDVDGVLTDGSIWFFPVHGEPARGEAPRGEPVQGEPAREGGMVEVKAFNSLDGAGLVQARQAGLQTGVITKRTSESLALRARDLKMEFVFQGVTSKLDAYREILAATGCREEEVCFIGDDLIDLSILRRAGLAVAVANAHEEIRKVAHYTTRASGGRGAVREVTDLLLKAQGKWKDVVARASK